MQTYTYRLTFLMVNVVCCLAVPLGSKATNSSAKDVPLIMGETTVTTHLHLSPQSAPLTSSIAKKERIKSHKPTNQVVKAKQNADDLDKDYTLLAEKVSSRIEDDYVDIGDDTIKPQAVVRPYTVAGATPIYITIPIYLNTMAGLPIALQIGNQQIPLGTSKQNQNVETATPDPSPTSQFNRLL